MANQSIPPLTVPPLVNKGLIAGLMKRNLWSIRPYISGGGGGYVGGRLVDLSSVKVGQGC